MDPMDQVTPVAAAEDTVNVSRSVIDQYEKRIQELTVEVNKRVPMILTFQGTIDAPPISPAQMMQQASGNDNVTVNHWREIWLKHIKRNKETHDIVGDSAQTMAGKFAYNPVIIAGSGPSLKKNAHLLKDKPDKIGLVSCLHNYAYFTDLGLHVDGGYINLDAGDITIPEMSQGGLRDEQYYWDSTQDATLVAGLVSKPELIDRWKGPIKWFSSPVPDMKYMEEERKLLGDFCLYYNVGGNALGASYYHARAILGGMPLAFIGADFAFDYCHKFHSWDSPYDAQFQGVIPCTDIFGNRVYTWPSYHNFCLWLTYQAYGGTGMNPVQMINCTEGGIFGAFPQGNVSVIKQLALIDFLEMYRHHELLPKLLGDPDMLKKSTLLF
jgi:hypothetical protein